MVELGNFISAVETAQTELERIDALNRLASELLKSNPNAAFTFADESLSRARETHHRAGLAESLRLVGACHSALCEYDLAGRQLGEAQLLFHTLGDTGGEARALNNLASVYWSLADYPQSLQHHQRSLKLFQQLNDRRSEARVTHDIGLVHQSLGDNLMALELFRKSHAVFQQTLDRQGEVFTLNSLGDVYLELGDAAAAQEHYIRALRLAEALRNLRAEALSRFNIGRIHHHKGDRFDAMLSLRQSLSIFQQIGDRRLEAAVLHSIGNAYRDSQDASNALDYYHQSLQLCQDIGDRLGEAEVWLNLGKLYLIPAAADAQVSPKSVECLITALRITEPVFSGNLACQIHYALVQAYKQIGNTAKALDHYEHYDRIKRQLTIDEQSKVMDYLQLAFAAEQSRIEAERQTETADLLRRVVDDYSQINHELGLALAEAERERAKAHIAQLAAEEARTEAALLSEALEKALVKLEEAYEESINQTRLALEANQFKTELLSIAAHDLKNPLQSVVGFAELICMDPDMRDSVYSRSQRIIEAANQMIELITRLLQSAAAEAGAVEVKRHLVDLSEIVQWTVAFNELLTDQKEQTIRFTAAPNCMITGDEGRLKEIVTNLISNAIKYAPPSTTIHVGVERSGTQARFSVRDEGQGLSLDDMAKLFKRFQRLSAIPTGGETSTGLGLAIVKQLVELHGGKVWAESAGKGKGATFVVELPLASP